MADLSEKETSQSVKIVGQGTDGIETDPISSTSNSLNTHLKDASGNTLGTELNPVFTKSAVAIISSIPSIEVISRKVVFAGQADYVTQAITTRSGIREFTFGGRGIGEGTLARYVDATTLVAGNGTGGFESAGDVSSWVDSGPLGVTESRSTVQFYAGASSLRLDYTKSDANNYPEVTYTFPTIFDASVWRYISAKFYQQPTTGGAAVVRTASVIMTSGTAKRFYNIVLGSLDAAGWLSIKIELEKPTSETGTGFDLQNINSMSLRMVDATSRVGTVYWDAVQFQGAVTIIQKIYTPGQTVRLAFDPIKVFNAGEVLMLITKNNDIAAKEFQIASAGVNV